MASRVSELAAISSLDDDDVLYVVEDGTPKKVTIAQLRAALGVTTDDPVFDDFGAAGTAFEFDTTSLAGLTALSSAADSEDADTTREGWYTVTDNDAGWSGRYCSVPAAPYTVVTKMLTNVNVANNVAGMFVGEATPGAMDLIYIVGSSRQLKTARWSTPTSYVGDIVASIGTGYVPYWFAIRVNSATDVDFLVSFDGTYWYYVTEARNPGITIASAGVAVNANSSGAVTQALFEYLRVYHSALAFLGAP